MEQHKSYINQLCRVCGKKPKGYMYKKTSSACKEALLEVFNIAAEREDNDIYPELVCNPCHLTLRQLCDARKEGRPRETDLVPQNWIPHTDNCPLCQDAPKVTRGRPKKRKAVGSLDDTHNRGRKIMHRLSNLHTPKYADHTLHISHFLSTPHLTHLTCNLCQCVPNEPIQLLGCQHLMCVACVRSRCEAETVTCACSTALSGDNFGVPSTLTHSLLESLLIHCTTGCGQVMELRHLKAHISSSCTNTIPPKLSTLTVQQLLDLQSDSNSELTTSALSLLIEKVAPGETLVCRSSSGRVSTPNNTRLCITYHFFSKLHMSE